MSTCLLWTGTRWRQDGLCLRRRATAANAMPSPSSCEAHSKRALVHSVRCGAAASRPSPPRGAWDSVPGCDRAGYQGGHAPHVEDLCVAPVGVLVLVLHHIPATPDGIAQIAAREWRGAQRWPTR